MSEQDHTERDQSGQQHTEQDVPSATVPGDVEPHGGQQPAEWSADGSYDDGNLDARGVEPEAGEPQADPDGAFPSLDGDLDTSPRTDGTGGSPDVGQRDVDPPRREGVEG